MLVGENEVKFNAANNHTLKVLMHHQIVNDEKLCSVHWTYVSTAQLRKQLILLEHWGYTPITLRDYLLYEKGEINLPKKPIILTFDDGYADVFQNAYPVIKEFGWNAVAFVLGDKNLKSNTWDKELSKGSSMLMNEEQMMELYDAGFEIGSHSMSHARLSTLPVQSAWFEIIRSKEKLQSILKSEVTSFSYPFGSLNDTIKEMVKRAGYKIACGVFSGPPKFGEDRFDIRRITISGSTNTLAYALKILTPFEYYEWLGSRTAKTLLATAHKYGFQTNEFKTNLTYK